MYEIGVVAQFEAAHHLSGDFGPATNLHGHTYRVEATLRGSDVRPDGSLANIGHLQSVVSDAVAGLHYKNLGELDAFAGRNSTGEAVARHLWDLIAPAFTGNGLQSLGVRVWESPQSFAAYEASLVAGQ